MSHSGFLRFKGNRNYLHGTDLFLWIMETINQPMPAFVNVSLDIRQQITHIPRLVEQCRTPEQRPVATFTVANDGHHSRHFGVFSTGQEIPHRVPYDETVIQSAMSSDQKDLPLATLKKLPQFSDIETWTAMNKLLLLHDDLRPRDPGQWMLTRLRLRGYRESAPMSIHTLTVESCSNPRLTRSAIAVDGETRGHMFFSWVRKTKSDSFSN